jgi:hypothetical protein
MGVVGRGHRGASMSDEARFEDLLASEFRWPRQGERAFVPAKRGLDNACVAPHQHTRLVMMMTGYKLAADLMVNRAAADRFDRDALVYPIIFNYRQFIELSLKYLISTYGNTVGVKAIWDTHSLDKLWRTFKTVLDAYQVDDPTGADPVVAAIVAEFSKMDPASFSYRYPVDTKGQPIPVAHDELDLAALAEVMQSVDMYFSGCDGYLDHLQGSAPLDGSKGAE